MHREDSTVWQFLSRIIKELGQAKGRIGEIERAVGPVDKVVRTVEPLPFILVGKYRECAVVLQTGNSVIAVLVDREASFAVEITSGLFVWARKETENQPSMRARKSFTAGAMARIKSRFPCRDRSEIT